MVRHLFNLNPKNERKWKWLHWICPCCENGCVWANSKQLRGARNKSRGSSDPSAVLACYYRFNYIINKCNQRRKTRARREGDHLAGSGTHAQQLRQHAHSRVKEVVAFRETKTWRSPQPFLWRRAELPQLRVNGNRKGKKRQSSDDGDDDGPAFLDRNEVQI